MPLLRHLRSTLAMLSKWLNHSKLSSPFGNQSTKYFESIRKLIASKYFAPYTLSVTARGTCSYVCKNYAFFACTQKYFYDISIS